MPPTNDNPGKYGKRINPKKVKKTGLGKDNTYKSLADTKLIKAIDIAALKIVSIKIPFLMKIKSS